MPTVTKTDSDLFERGVLQVRAMVPETYQAMRVECAIENVTLATLIDAMWQAYSERKYDGKLPTAHRRTAKRPAKAG